MKKQCIITIGREYGSGGHVIGKMLADRLGLKFYDHNLLDEIAEEMQIDVKEFSDYDEHPSRYIFSRRVNGYSNSMEDIVAEWQFDYMKKCAEEGESFVIVGRCAEWILRDMDCKTSIFILGDEKAKRKRLMDEYGYSKKDAKDSMVQVDKKRKSYHNRFCETKWGDSRGYELCINSSKLGIEGTVDLIEAYIRLRDERDR